mmetsp:Transcript_1268/g.2153  ORF Transcript_1268/g.2153 Transcript_1268/m.2153 type:complete len:542 (-) Transcript_1268:22-1647(-)
MKIEPTPPTPGRSAQNFRKVDSSTGISRRFTTFVAEHQTLLRNLELYGMAGLSMADMVTDIMMTLRFLETGASDFALASGICISVTLGLQAVGTFLMNFRMPWRKQLLEQLISWSHIRPGVDAYRVAMDHNDANSAANARSQMTGFRCLEMVCEGIPGTVIQLSALFLNGDFSPTAIVSLASSILTSACISAHLSYHWDTSEQEREKQPRFYGYFPDSTRGQVIVFSLLLLMSLLTLVIRSLSVILLSWIGGFQLVGAVLGGELAIYLLQKLLRRDFLYWIPSEGFGGLLLAFFLRIIIKVAYDWSSVVQFRHQSEVGGYYSTFTLCFTVALGMVCALIYETDNTSEGVEYYVEQQLAIQVMGSCCVGLLLSFVVFLFSIKPDYARTFFDTRTASKYIQDSWHSAETDIQKFNCLVFNEVKWRTQIGEEVKAWVNKMLPLWLDAEEEGALDVEGFFFDDYTKSLVPDWIVEDPTILNEIRNERVMEFMTERRSLPILKTSGSLALNPHSSQRWSGSQRASHRLSGGSSRGSRRRPKMIAQP